MPTKQKTGAKNTGMSSLEDLILDGNKINLRNATRQIVKTVVIVETLKTLLREDKQIQGVTTLEEMQDLCRQFGLKNWRQKEKESVLEIIQKYFVEQINTKEKFSELYQELFAHNETIFTFPEFLLNEDTVPKDDDEVDPNINFEVECLGTGEYDKDTKGNELPHDKEFIDECLHEICHFQSHLAGENLFMPDKSPDFTMDIFDNEKIFLMVQFKNPLELIS